MRRDRGSRQGVKAAQENLIEATIAQELRMVDHHVFEAGPHLGHQVTRDVEAVAEVAKTNTRQVVHLKRARNNIMEIRIYQIVKSPPFRKRDFPTSVTMKHRGRYLGFSLMFSLGELKYSECLKLNLII